MTQIISNKIANLGIVCALLVLFIHLPIGKDASTSARYVYSLFSHGIGKMAVPFFFMASGYLLAGHFGEEGWHRKALAKRVRTLWLPMVLWSALFFLWGKVVLPVGANLIAGRPLLANVTFLPTWTEIARILAIHPFEEPYLGVLWFVRMLFVLVVISPLLKRLATPWGVLCLYVLQALVGPELGGTPPPLRFTLLKGVFPICGAAFFCLGMMLRERGSKLEIPKSHGVMLLFITLLALVFRGHPYVARIVPLITWGYVPLLILAAWSLCPARKFPDFMIKTAFPVYVMHMFAITLAKRCVLDLGRYATLYLATGMACFFICIAAAWSMRKAFPKVSAVLFGGR